MQKLSMLVLVLMILAFMAACGGTAKKPYHDTPLGDPMQYKAHFGDIDTNGDEMVKWYEFKKYFPQGPDAGFKINASIVYNIRVCQEQLF